MPLGWGPACPHWALSSRRSYLAVPQNHIPVLSPALTDGSLGDMIFFHSYKNPGLVLDIVEGEVPGPQSSRGGGLAGSTA